jgi:DNA-binding transcriptional ArsR family regulator
VGDGRRDLLCLDLRKAERLRAERMAERAENLVSHHLRALRSAGLVTSRRDGKMVLYSLAPAGHALLAALDHTVDVPA